jgi:hypothetical protein
MVNVAHWVLPPLFSPPGGKGGYEKIIQQAMRMVMETVLEPTFLDSSHGFRFGRGCHTALRQVKS